MYPYSEVFYEFCLIPLHIAEPDVRVSAHEEIDSPVAVQIV